MAMDMRHAYLEERLVHRVRWLEKVRLSAACIYAMLVWLAYSVFKIQTDYPLVIAILVLLFLNATACRLFPLKSSYRKDVFLAQSLLFDIVLVSLVLFFTGGYANPFSTMLLLYVFLAAVALDQHWTWVAFITASVSYVSLFWWYHPVELFDSHGHHSHHAGFSLHLYGMLFSFILLGALFAWFFSRYHKERNRIEEELFSLKTRDLEDQRLIGLANFCAGAAHELGNPLATCRLILDDLITSTSDCNEIHKEILELDKEIGRISEVVKKMRSSVEVEGEVPREYSLKELVNSIRKEAEMISELDLDITLTGNGSLFTFRHGLVSSILILLRNASHAYGPDQRSRKVKLQVKETPHSVAWNVSDVGTGMDSSTLERLGEPFFTTKEPGKGMGLGVYLAKSFSRLVGGSLEFVSMPGKGTQAILTVPKKGL
jgi:two-component system, sensor histidine kinase RegB